MPGGKALEDEIRPESDIRRFDVFAEYNRLEKEREGMPDDEAKGYGIWIAKYVAGRKFAKTPAGPKKPTEEGKRERTQLVDQKWRTLGGKLQTDETFDEEIIERMGREFYEDVFSPAIREAVEEGKDYKSIRDSIRRDWNEMV